ncbi:MAG: hypothetical protein ACMUIE_05110 [Thermoplasmatota archaeon]
MVTYQKVKSMVKKGEVAELVLSMDHASPTVLPFVLKALREFSEKGESELMVRLDITSRLRRILESEDEVSKKEVVFLLGSLISQGYGKRILDESTVSLTMGMLRDDTPVFNISIIYLVPVFIDLGFSDQVVSDTALQTFRLQLEREDRDSLYYTLCAVDSVTAAGYEQNISRAGFEEHLKRLKWNQDFDISSLASNTFIRIQKWKDIGLRKGNVMRSSEELIDEKVLQERKEEKLEDRTTQEGYLRPKRGAGRKTAKKSRFTSNGKKVQTREDKEEIVELKKPTSTPSLEYMKRIRSEEKDT